MTTAFYISYVGLWLLVVFQSLLLIGLVRSGHGRSQDVPVRDAADGLPLGTKAPEFSVPDADGHIIDNSTLRGQLTALLFVSPSCSTCSVTLEELEALKLKVDGNVIVFCRAKLGECRELIERYGLTVPVAVDADHHVSELFQVVAAPTAVLIDTHGRVQRYGFPSSSDDLEVMIADEAMLPPPLEQMR